MRLLPKIISGGAIPRETVMASISGAAQMGSLVVLISQPRWERDLPALREGAGVANIGGRDETGAEERMVVVKGARVAAKGAWVGAPAAKGARVVALNVEAPGAVAAKGARVGAPAAPGAVVVAKGARVSSIGFLSGGLPDIISRYRLFPVMMLFRDAVSCDADAAVS